MPALDLEPASAAPDTELEVIPAGPAEAAAQSFSAEGDLPAVATPELTPPAAAATASELAFENVKSPSKDDLGSDLDHGMVDWEVYKYQCEHAGKPEMWKDEYVHGHTEASQWTQPYEHGADNDFRLKTGQSASDALRGFIKGPTITNWHTVKVALEMEDVLSEIGDQKFDRLFGSDVEVEDHDVPKAQRLRITGSDGPSSYVDHMRVVADRYDAREAEPVRVEELVEHKVAEGPKEPRPQIEELVAQQDLELEQQAQQAQDQQDEHERV